MHETQVDAVAMPALDDLEHQVELRGRRTGLGLGDLQSGQLRQRLTDHAAVGEQHLEQRVVGPFAGRRDLRDHFFERHVGVGEPAEVHGSHLAQQGVEGLGGVDDGAQGHGADEHADETLEPAVAATGHDGADGDVVTSAAAREQRDEHSVGQHEHRHVVAACALAHPLVKLGTQAHDGLLAAVRRTRGPRPVGG